MHIFDFSYYSKSVYVFKAFSKFNLTMKGWIVLVNKLPADGMAIFPFILLKKSRLPITKTLIQHERIHLQQQIELLLIPMIQTNMSKMIVVSPYLVFHFYGICRQLKK